MSAPGEDGEGIRGTDLADEAAPDEAAPGAASVPESLAEQGIRGDGWARDA